MTDRLPGLAGRVAVGNVVRPGPSVRTEVAALAEAHGNRFAALLAVVANGSSFLWTLVRGDPARLARLAATSPEASLDAIIAAQGAIGHQFECGEIDRETAMRRLRRNRAELALLVGLADLGQVWTVDEVTQALTRFADASVGSAVAIAMGDGPVANGFDRGKIGDAGDGSGLVILAFGKHGAGELNYSSDIDLVVFFDPKARALAAEAEPARLYNRIAQAIVRLLSERTADGYVHRVDYRLRPDPGSTPAAVSLPAAYTYYETVGQNWERAAMIKARPIAGDLGLGRGFLADLEPFIWRKYFDFASIADIHAMKRQIHAVRGFDEIAVAGHDIKLGRGGIREIEFFVQTQQLVFGGRRPSLRGRRTLDLLQALEAENWITAGARDELSQAYRFLRTIEHRLQMVADEQTQRIPSDPADLKRLAAFAGYRSVAAFGRDVVRHATRVQHHYELLFQASPGLAIEAGDLVFTGPTDDPATLATLASLGFRQPELAAETVRGWHFGRRAAVTSARAREVLTDLVPSLLQALGGTADPDGALARLDRALGRMPAAVELLTILRSDKRLRLLFADLLGTAPRLADTVATSPHVLDAVIDPSFANSIRDEDEAEADLRALVGQPAGTEEFLDRIRDAAQQLQFVTGARLLSGVFSPAEAGTAFAAIACAAIRVSLDWVAAAFSAEHGQVSGGEIAVVGLGRLGTGDLTATSDLDLMVVYDFDAERRESDGPRPLDAVAYYTRLTQRLIAALTVPTRRGKLFDVDMRLRPSGTKGPVASQFSGFVAYHAHEAELWEHMALTRARVLAGRPGFRERLQAEIGATVARVRDVAQVFRDAAAMRELVAREKEVGDRHDVKLARGGLMDLDFLAQALVLAHAVAHPTLIGRASVQVFAEAGRVGLLETGQVARLVTAYNVLDGVLHFQRLILGGATPAADPGAVILDRLAALAGAPDGSSLVAYIDEVRGEVRPIYQAIMGK